MSFGENLAEKEDLACWPTIVALIDVAASRWTDRQALAVKGALRGMPQTEIAELWSPPIKQSTVNGHLSKAGWGAVSQALNLFKRTLKRHPDLGADHRNRLESRFA